MRAKEGSVQGRDGRRHARQTLLFDVQSRGGGPAAESRISMMMMMGRASTTERSHTLLAYISTRCARPQIARTCKAAGSTSALVHLSPLGRGPERTAGRQGSRRREKGQSPDVTSWDVVCAICAVGFLARFARVTLPRIDAMKLYSCARRKVRAAAVAHAGALRALAWQPPPRTRLPA